MKTAYLDCFSGISGDMFLGALVDAGLSFDELRQQLKTLPLEDYDITAVRESRMGLSGVHIAAAFEGSLDTPRHLSEIRQIVRQSRFSESVKRRSIDIFEALARVEGEIHGCSMEEVHFHEVGAVDAIIDIVGAVYGLEALGIQSLHVSALPLGSGFTEAGHGRIPLPAPATIALLEGVPVFHGGLDLEMVTPTGAALVKGLAASFGPMPHMVIKKVGYGAGTRELPDRPNLARLLIGETSARPGTDTVVVLETNLDDADPEWVGYLMERLLEQGALDVALFPIHMKKNRPGVQVQVIASPEKIDRLVDLFFKESTALGVRFRYSQRRILKRSETEVESPWGKMRVKEVFSGDGTTYFQPEFDACREIARAHDLPLKEIFYWVMGLNRK